MKGIIVKLLVGTYTDFNDGSLRDYQRKAHQWMPGKNFDQTGAISPEILSEFTTLEPGGPVAIARRPASDMPRMREPRGAGHG